MLVNLHDNTSREGSDPQQCYLIISWFLSSLYHFLAIPTVVRNMSVHF